MIRRYGKPAETGRRYRLRRGVYGVLWRDGRVLLTHQGAPRSEFQLPGGGIDPGESPLQALHREVREETGWCIGAPRHLGAFRRYTYMPEYDIWAEKLCMIYLARAVRQKSAPLEPDHAAVMVAPEVAVDLLANSGDAAFLQGVLRWLR